MATLVLVHLQGKRRLKSSHLCTCAPDHVALPAAVRTTRATEPVPHPGPRTMHSGAWLVVVWWLGCVPPRPRSGHRKLAFIQESSKLRCAAHKGGTRFESLSFFPCEPTKRARGAPTRRRLMVLLSLPVEDATAPSSNSKLPMGRSSSTSILPQINRGNARAAGDFPLGLSPADRSLLPMQQKQRALRLLGHKSYFCCEHCTANVPCHTLRPYHAMGACAASR